MAVLCLDPCSLYSGTTLAQAKGNISSSKTDTDTLLLSLNVTEDKFGQSQVP